MSRIRNSIITAFIFALLFLTGVSAQTEQLTLKMTRDWGYGGLNGDIQGLFTIKVTGPADLSKVDFFIDSKLVGEVTTQPFNIQFTTDDYGLGLHQISAVGYSPSGIEYKSNVVSANFVPKQAVGNFIFPVLGAVAVILLLSALFPFISARRKQLSTPLGAERKYGTGGGGICPKCQRPFAIPFFSAHFGFSKLAVCPYCGKVSLVRVESLNNLRLAERAELDWSQSKDVPQGPKAGEFQKDIDDSKFQDL